MLLAKVFLLLEDSKAMDLQNRIWNELGANPRWKGFFITAEIAREGECYPSVLSAFLDEKWEKITQEKIVARRFVYQREGWRIYLTFFPTETVVEEKYALKNKVLFR